jgi:hypothetical protein
MTEAMPTAENRTLRRLPNAAYRSCHFTAEGGQGIPNGWCYGGNGFGCLPTFWLAASRGSRQAAEVQNQQGGPPRVLCAPQGSAENAGDFLEQGPPDRAPTKKKARERRIAQLVAALPHDRVSATQKAHEIIATPIEAVRREEYHESRVLIGDRRRVIFDAAQGNVDPAADIGPIKALLDQGCSFKRDVLPIVAQMVPELPRPLKNWGAKWLVQAILEARDQRLHPILKDVAALVENVVADLAREAPREAPGSLIQRVVEAPADDEATEDRHRAALAAAAIEAPELTDDLMAILDGPAGQRLAAMGSAIAETIVAAVPKVEAPPPARRLSAMDWDEFVAGHRAGLIEWNTARLSPGRGGAPVLPRASDP